MLYRGQCRHAGYDRTEAAIVIGGNAQPVAARRQRAQERAGLVLAAPGCRLREMIEQNAKAPLLISNIVQDFIDDMPPARLLAFFACPQLFAPILGFLT